MSTSLADLLDALDFESRSPRLAPADGTAALGHVSRSLQLIADNLVERTKNPAAITLNSLSQSASVVAEAWPASAGRNAQLAGVVEDVLALHIKELNEPDLRVAAVTLTACSSRYALCIQANSASHAPALDRLIGDATEMRRRQAAQPASAADCTVLFRPFSAAAVPDRISSAETVAESIESVLDFLCQSGRSPLTVRQVIAVCRVSEVVSARLEQASERPGSLQAAGWRELREKVALLSDGQREPGHGGNQRLMVNAATADRTIMTMNSDELKHSPALDRAVALLPSIAKQIEAEVRRIHPTLIVPVGERPLAGQAAGYWLCGIAYQPRLNDLEPIFDAADTLIGRRHERFDVLPEATLSVG